MNIKLHSPLRTCQLGTCADKCNFEFLLSLRASGEAQKNRGVVPVRKPESLDCAPSSENSSQNTPLCGHLAIKVIMVPKNGAKMVEEET